MAWQKGAMVVFLLLGFLFAANLISMVRTIRQSAGGDSPASSRGMNSFFGVLFRLGLFLIILGGGLLVYTVVKAGTREFASLLVAGEGAIIVIGLVLWVIGFWGRSSVRSGRNLVKPPISDVVPEKDR